MTADANAVGVYIDRKADFARSRAKTEPMEAEFYNNLAIVLEILADEIRMGLHEMKCTA